jgi:hypothetical protein
MFIIGQAHKYAMRPTCLTYSGVIRDPATGAPGMACAHPGEGGSSVSDQAERGVSAAASIAAGAVIGTNLIAFSGCSSDKIKESVGDPETTGVT